MRPALTGPYCAACGQHATTAPVLSACYFMTQYTSSPIGQPVLADAVHVAVAAGRLTQEYFAERRVRYLPPVRVYLVLSLLFFALGPFGAHSSSQTAAVPQSGPRARSMVNSVRAPTKPAYFNVEFSDCDKIESSFKWLESPLRQACRRTWLGRRSGAGRLLGNIPKKMFAFLPMIALVMLLLYWRPRRFTWSIWCSFCIHTRQCS